MPDGPDYDKLRERLKRWHAGWFGKSLCPVPGLAYATGFVTADEERVLLEKINSMPWDKDTKYMNRRVQQYGWKYDYVKRCVAPEDLLGELPEFLLPLIERLHAVGILDETTQPDQCIINEYEPGVGIAPHIDLDAFGNEIVSISLGSNCRMVFDNVKTGATFDAFLAQRLVVRFKDEARHKWRHTIPARTTDVGPDGVGRTHRRRRVSITFRQVTNPRESGS